MIPIPPSIAALIESQVRGDAGSLSAAIDLEARSHGAIAVMGAIGMTWGLRPDGTFWQFDREYEVELTPLPADCETQALAWGSRRFPWLSALLPTRDAAAVDCTGCGGTGMLSPTWMCPRCEGLGWIGGARRAAGPKS